MTDGYACARAPRGGSCEVAPQYRTRALGGRMLDEVYFSPGKQGEIGGVIEPRSTLAKPPFFPEIGTTSVSQLGYILFCLKTETLKPHRVQDEGAAST